MMRLAILIALGVVVAVSGTVCAVAFRATQKLAGEDVPWVGPE